jgi:hypothetical protein
MLSQYVTRVFSFIKKVKKFFVFVMLKLVKLAKYVKAFLPKKSSATFIYYSTY